MKHIISQTAGADENELNESKNSCKIIGKKENKYLDFIRKYEMTVKIMKHKEMWCYKSNNQSVHKSYFEAYDEQPLRKDLY